MLTHPLLPKLRQLKLSGMLDTLSVREEYARLNQISHAEFLALLLDDEIERRDQGRLVRQEKAAGFDSPRRLSQFDFSAAPRLNRAQVMEIATCQFVRRHENWLLYGPSGVGKSHLATAIGYEAIRQGMTVVSGQANHIVADLISGRGDGTRARRLRQLGMCDLLFLDDFGLRPFTPSGAEEMYELIRLRYERGSIVITSNRAPEEWPGMFGDGLLASAALDRLTHHAHLTLVEGASYRQRERRSMLTGSESSRDDSGFGNERIPYPAPDRDQASRDASGGG